MGLFDFLLRLFRPSDLEPPATASGPVEGPHAETRRFDQTRSAAATATLDGPGRVGPTRLRRRKPRLVPLRNKPNSRNRWSKAVEETAQPPYRFAQFGVRYGGYIDLSTDGDETRLARYGLPRFRTPDELADWLEMPVGKVAWLVHRFCENYQPESARQSHYHCRWQKKRAGGWRLIESPKTTLRAAQTKILKEILDRVPPHPAAHGFVTGRSIVSNAQEHLGQRVVVKFDLENFYATVTMARVTAIFRSVGYSREASIWLARLTTSTLPPNLPCPENNMT
ncbi:MAG: reverse transcriptase domain-containing protein, partial [Planctomycetaceae bacterium]